MLRSYTKLNLNLLRPEVTQNLLRPEVTVDLLRPEVTVNLLLPEVTVDLLRPEVTVDLLRPEVTVDLPSTCPRQAKRARWAVTRASPTRRRRNWGWRRWIHAAVTG